MLMFGAKSKSGRSAKATVTVNNAIINQQFDSLADEDDPELISMSGICRMAEILSLDASSDVRILVLLWRLGAKSKPGSITRSEFLEGMRSLQKEKIEDFKSTLAELDPGFLMKEDFRDFYKFVFQFSREGTHKTLENEVVRTLLPIVLDEQRAPHVSQFLEFLSQSAHTRITLDQWESFLQFNAAIGLDLQGFDDDGAWPLMLDEYVDWRKSRK